MRSMFSYVVAMATFASAALGQAPKPGVVALRDVFGADKEVREIAATSDGRRIYYDVKIPSGVEVWLYDRDNKTSHMITSGDLWYLNVAPDGSALAYTKTGEKSNEEYVWTLPLDPRTGLATGPERRVSMIQGDTPSISPDGRSLAFARDDSANTGQSLVVVPLNGGPERILVDLDVGIDVIRWKPDGKTIYFGTNPPRARRTEPGSIQRIEVSGGTPTIVAKTSNPWPGLSLDGKLLVYRDTGLAHAMVVADAAGKRLGTFMPPPNSTVRGWIGNATVVSASDGRVQRVISYSLADGRSRTLVDSTPGLYMPNWSPDGKRIAVFHSDGMRSELRVMSPDGSNRRSIPLHDAEVAASSWSPDGRWIAYRTLVTDGHEGVLAIDVVTGREVRLSDDTTKFYWLWWPDDRHIIAVSQDPSDPAVPRRRATVHEFDLEGHHRVLRELPLDAPGWGVYPIGRDSLVVQQASGVTVEPMQGGAPVAKLLPGDLGFVSLPTFSADHRWVSFRRSPGKADNQHMTVLEVMQVDGTHRTTVTLPFDAAPGYDTPQFLPGGTRLVLSENRANSATPGVYLVTLPGGSAKKLFTIADPRGNANDFSVSPDGRTILYATSFRVPITAFSIDLASFVPKAMSSNGK